MDTVFLTKPTNAVVIGASSGGPPALEYILSKLPKDLNAVVIVIQHLPILFTKSLALRFEKFCPLPVTQMLNGEYIKNQHIYIVPGGFHFALTYPNFQTYLLATLCSTCPSIDMGFTSVAEHFTEKTIGVVLTGMGSDGTLGAKTVKQVGGLVIAQDKASSAIYGMPRSIIENNLADFILPLSEIPKKIISLLEK